MERDDAPENENWDADILLVTRRVLAILQNHMPVSTWRFKDKIALFSISISGLVNLAS